MANNLRVFNSNSEYQSADLVHPAVSYVIETDKVIYEPTPVFKGKWKATYSDSHTESAQCGSSGEIVRNEINLTNLVSVEIGNCVTRIGNRAFYQYTSLTNIDIPNSVTSIGGYAFWKCTSLTSIEIPDSVTSIDEGAFEDCSTFTSCTIGSGVTSIGSFAFWNCSSLTSVTIPSGVTSIGERAFQECRKFTSITVNAITPPRLGANTFYNTNNCKIYVTSASVNAYKSASGWSEYASRIQPIP